MNKFQFNRLRVYHLAKELHSKCVKIAKSFPRDYYYLADQLRRASLSIVLNIAEGSGKESIKDFRRYIENSLGSINEVSASLDVAHDERLIADTNFSIILKECCDLKNQLGSLSKKLKFA